MAEAEAAFSPPRSSTLRLRPEGRVARYFGEVGSATAREPAPSTTDGRLLVRRGGKPVLLTDVRNHIVNDAFLQRSTSRGDLNNNLMGLIASAVYVAVRVWDCGPRRRTTRMPLDSPGGSDYHTRP